MKVLVLGGTGFIGRHAVAALLARGDRVTIGSRHPARAARRYPGLPLVATRMERLGRVEAWAALLEGHQAVVNCVGILRERGRETYAAIHADAPAALAEACRQRGLRLVHVSALALEYPHRSRFLRSKLEGERRLLASGADACLVRPSLLDGAGGFGARWIRGLSRSPVHLVPHGARGRIAALDVVELGEALAALAHWPIAEDGRTQVFEFGGPQAMDIAQYLQALRRRDLRPPARQLRVPDLVTRAASHVFDMLHFSPLSFGHWELLRHDNLPRNNRLEEVLGRCPHAPAALSPGSLPRPHRGAEPCTEASP